MSVDQRLDGIVDDTQHGLGRGAHLVPVTRPNDQRQHTPQPPRRRQIEVDGLAGADAMFGRTTTHLTDGLELSFLRPAPRRGGVRKDRQILTEQLDRGAGGRGG